MTPRGRWSAVLREVAEVLESLFRRRGRDADSAAADADAVACELATYFGGRNWYLPRNLKEICAVRDAAIAREANGQNTRELAQRHGVTERRVQMIVKAERERRRRENGLDSES